MVGQYINELHHRQRERKGFWYMCSYLVPDVDPPSAYRRECSCAPTFVILWKQLVAKIRIVDGLESL